MSIKHAVLMIWRDKLRTDKKQGLGGGGQFPEAWLLGGGGWARRRKTTIKYELLISYLIKDELLITSCSLFIKRPI